MSHWVREERVTNGPSHIRSPVSCITGHSGLPLGNRSLPGTPEHSRPAGGLGRLRGQWAEGLLGQGHWGSGPPPGRAGPLPEAQPATVGAPGQDSHKPWIFGSGAERPLVLVPGSRFTTTDDTATLGLFCHLVSGSAVPPEPHPSLVPPPRPSLTVSPPGTGGMPRRCPRKGQPAAWLRVDTAAVSAGRRRGLGSRSRGPSLGRPPLDGAR